MNILTRFLQRIINRHEIPERTGIKLIHVVWTQFTNFQYNLIDNKLEDPMENEYFPLLKSFRKRYNKICEKDKLKLEKS